MPGTYVQLGALVGSCLLLGALAGCASEGDTPPSTTRAVPATSVVGDGARVDLEPGSNLPPTDAERTGEDGSDTSIAEPGSTAPND